MPEQLADAKHISLSTRKRDGSSVATPVWFAECQGKLYVRTVADSGKVKRIRNFPAVELAPCNATGQLTGEWVNASAQALNDDHPQIAAADRALQEKYGDERTKMTEMMASKGIPLAYIEIAL